MKAIWASMVLALAVVTPAAAQSPPPSQVGGGAGPMSQRPRAPFAPSDAGAPVSASFASASHIPQRATPTRIDRHKLSYAIGYRIGSRFADGHPDVDIDTLIKALRDAYANRKPDVSMRDMDAQLVALEHQLRAQARTAFEHMAKVNAARSAKFMAANAKKAGIVTLPSGVQYKVLKHGSGPHPSLRSTVKLNYRGSLINGMEFDSSYAHGKPVTYPVNKMLPGWRDVLPRMRVGGKWKVFIPPSQAYGVHGELPRIGPNEVLVFEIELLNVK